MIDHHDRRLSPPYDDSANHCYRINNTVSLATEEIQPIAILESKFSAEGKCNKAD